MKVIIIENASKETVEKIVAGTSKISEMQSVEPMYMPVPYSDQDACENYDDRDVYPTTREEVVAPDGTTPAAEERLADRLQELISREVIAITDETPSALYIQGGNKEVKDSLEEAATACSSHIQDSRTRPNAWRIVKNGREEEDNGEEDLSREGAMGQTAPAQSESHDPFAELFKAVFGIGSETSERSTERELDEAIKEAGLTKVGEDEEMSIYKENQRLPLVGNARRKIEEVLGKTDHRLVYAGNGLWYTVR